MLIIIGVLAVPAIQAYEIYKQQQDYARTQEALQGAASGLAQYFAVNGFYPCPADPDLPLTDANHGNAVGRAGTQCNDMATGIIANNGNEFGNPPGTSADWDLSGDPLNDRVVFGSVPYETLQIPLRDAIDSYGSKIVYAVTETMTLAGSDDRGAIQVLTIADGTGLTEETIDVTASNDVAPVDGLPDSGAHQFVLYSPGPNRLGAVSKNGVGTFGCVGSSDADNVGDDENCDLNSTFLFSYPYENAGPFFYDDQFLFRSWSFGSLWDISPTDANAIYNKNPGNVGVGTDSPQEKLHVEGNLIVDSVQAIDICDETGNCFPPELIGGEIADGNGMDCGTNFLIGVNEGNPECLPVTLNVPTGQSCPLGEFVRAIDSSGSIICDVP